jgi:Bacterial PH domain
MAPPGQHQELDRYLLDGERLVTAVHQHWGKVAEPVASAVLAGMLALWVDATIPPKAGLVSTVLWWAWFAVLGRAAYRIAEWRHDWFVATDKRLLLFYGFVTRKVSMMPLTKVTDMSYNRSIPGRVFGYGRFVMESAGQDQALREVNWVPDPDRNYRAICAEIFGVPGQEEAVDDWDDEGPTEPPSPRAPWGGADGPHRPDDPGGSLYRSPDLRGRDRSADTGPIPIYPPRQDWDR